MSETAGTLEKSREFKLIKAQVTGVTDWLEPKYIDPGEDKTTDLFWDNRTVQVQMEK